MVKYKLISCCYNPESRVATGSAEELDVSLSGDLGIEVENCCVNK